MEGTVDWKWMFDAARGWVSLVVVDIPINRW